MYTIDTIFVVFLQLFCCSAFLIPIVRQCRYIQPCFYFRSQSLYYHSISASRLSSISTVKTQSLPFQLSTATILAGYAFEAYNEPNVGKTALGEDGTKITFTSADFIRRIFQGVVMITLNNGTIGSRSSVSQQPLFESFATGSLPDPYLMVSAVERESNGPPKNIEERVIDIARTSCIQNSFSPEWKETYFLYIQNASLARLNISLVDRNIFSEDFCMGANALSLTDLIANTASSIKAINVPIPLYIPKKKGWFDFGSNAKRERTGTVNADLQFIPWDSRADLLASQAKVPKGASPDADWETLLSKLMQRGAAWDMSMDGAVDGEDSLLGTARRGLHEVCRIENDDTDTQAAMFVDEMARRLVVSFRGTEQTKLKDILTDLNLAQVSMYDDLPDVKLHKGFLSAYLSVRSSILQMLGAAFRGNQLGPWRVFITGHSLGGALATLLAFDLEMIRNRSLDEQKGPSLLPVSENLMLGIRSAVLQTYTMGAPRVGNVHFAELFSKLLSTNPSRCSLFRVVNKEDIVPRIPRSPRINRLLQYEHVGKTVLVDDGADDEAMLWIDGQSGGPCPLADLSPFSSANKNNSDLQSTSFPLNIEGGINGTFNALLSNVESVIPSLFQVNVSNALNIVQTEILKTVRSQLGQQSLGEIGGMNLNEIKVYIEGIAVDVASGVDSAFVERELALLKSIVEGRALEHHLEPSYFSALEKIVMAPSKIGIENKA